MGAKNAGHKVACLPFEIKVQHTYQLWKIILEDVSLFTGYGCLLLNTSVISLPGFSGLNITKPFSPVTGSTFLTKESVKL